MILNIIFYICVVVSCSSAENPQQRILGGDGVSIDQAPWHAIILYSNVEGDDVSNYIYETSGALIRDDLIAVPARLLSDRHAFRKVRAGSSEALEGGEIAEIKEITFHEQFEERDFNLAVVLLQAPFKLTELIAPIALISKGANYPDGTWATITGYGTQAVPGNPKWWLKMVAVPLVNHDLCRQIYLGYNLTITDRDLCAGNLAAPGNSPCNSDGGGPLVIDKELVGLFHMHWNCGLNGDPTVYVDISVLRDWLQDKIDNLH